MKCQIRVDNDAEQELTEAVRWYESQRSGLGEELLQAVATGFKTLAENPALGSRIDAVARGRLRRFLVPKFPYQIIYESRPNEIAVVAVAHLKRRPGYWKSR